MKKILFTLTVTAILCSCNASESKEQKPAPPSDCECKEISSRLIMGVHTTEDLEKMKLCINSAKTRNDKVAHGNSIGDIAEIFAGFCDLCP